MTRREIPIALWRGTVVEVVAWAGRLAHVRITSDGGSLAGALKISGRAGIVLARELEVLQ